MGWQDAPIVTKNAWESAPEVDAPKLKGGDSSDLGRTAALAGRAAWRGAASLADFVANPFAAARKALGDTSRTPGDDLVDLPDNLTAALGISSYKPETAGERTLSKVVEGGVGALAGPGAGAKAAISPLLSGGVAGGAGAAIEESGGSPLAQLLASLAGGLTTSGVIEGTKAVGRGARNVLDPLTSAGAERAATRLANETAGPNKAQVVAALSNADSGVNGLKLNAGQASVPSGSAEFAALQKSVDTFRPTPAAALEASQEVARRGAIQSIGQDKQALADAVKARSVAAGENYRKAYDVAIKADPELAQLSSNPYFKDAVPEALKMAKAKGLDPKSDMTEFLQGVKLALDDKLTKVGEGALGNSQKALVTDVKKQLVDWLGRKNPQYDAARTQFAADSKPINQMQVGQYLEDKLVAPLETGERAATFATAMRDSPRTIKNSTGQAMYDNLGQVLTPQQESVANAVLKNLKNEATYNNLASKGAPATRKIVGDFAEPVPTPRLLSRVATVANAIINRIEGKGSKATMNSLADLMDDPQRMAKLMAAATPDEKQTLADAFARAGAAGAASR